MRIFQLFIFKQKIEKNIERDKYVVEQLEKQGWLVIRFWEKQEVLSNLPQCVSKVKKAIEERADRSKNLSLIQTGVLSLLFYFCSHPKMNKFQNRC